jgi:hypothetical protein
MRPFLRTTLAGDDRGPRALAAFSMLIGVYLVVRAIGLDPVPALVSRLSGEARGSTVVATAPQEPQTTDRRRASATPSKHGRHARLRVATRTTRTTRTTLTKTAHPRRRPPADRRTEAQPSSGGAAPTATATPERPNEPKPDVSGTPPTPPVPDPAPPIAPPPPPVHLPDPPTVPLPDPTAAVDPGTLTPPVALPVEPPLPNLPSLP